MTFKVCHYIDKKDVDSYSVFLRFILRIIGVIGEKSLKGLIRKTIMLSSFLAPVVNVFSQSEARHLFNEDYLNSFFKACYIDTLNARFDNPEDIRFSYICNGYGGHWQIFGQDAKGTIILRYDEVQKPSTNGIIIKEDNNSGITCYAIVDWNYEKGKIYFPQEPLNKEVFNKKVFPQGNVLNIPPFALNETIWNFSDNAINQKQMLSSDVIPIIKPVINPDNILYISKELATSKRFGEQFIKECVNPNTYFGYYVKQSWGSLFNSSLDKYDFTLLDKYFKDCVDHNTRLTLRIDQTEGDWDKFYIEKPSNWKHFEEQYKQFLDNNHTWFFDDNNFLYIDSLIVTGSYPSKLFFEQIIEGNNPMIKKRYNIYLKDTCYTTFFNYNSDCVYNEWVRLQKSFYKYINKRKIKNKEGKKIKCKFLIENLYAAVGITGEGYVGEFGVFPDDKSKYLRYYEAFAYIFKDMPVSYPLAVTYDDKYLNDEDLSLVLNRKNKLINGRNAYSGLWYDVIGLKGFVPYSYYSNSKKSKLIEAPNNRRFCGEGAFNDDSCSQVLTHAYLMHLSGVSQHNIPFNKTEISRKQQQKYTTLAGAKLSISEAEYRDRILKFGIQNIGYCRVFSPYWQAYLIIRDKKGSLLLKKEIPLDLFEIEPNSYDYDDVGVYNESPNTISVPLKLPRKAKTISFAIIDNYGIYENYWMHNKDRVSFSGDIDLKDGEYIIITL